MDNKTTVPGHIEPKNDLCVLVNLLLGLALVVTDIARYFLGPIAGKRTKDGVLLAANAVHRTLSVTLGLSGVVLCFASGVLSLSRLLP